jgi:hypothetical protein
VVALVLVSGSIFGLMAKPALLADYGDWEEAALGVIGVKIIIDTSLKDA